MCLFLFKASKTVDIRSDQDLGDNSAKLLQVPYKSADLITSGLTNYQHININSVTEGGWFMKCMSFKIAFYK